MVMRSACQTPGMELWTCHLGAIEYGEATALQESLRERVIAGELPPLLLLLEHPAVYTLGRRSEPGDLPFGAEFWRARGIDVVATRRGGKLTYHGPGQLVGYPIMPAPSLPAFVRTMEAALVAALAEEGIAARGRDADGPQYTGVWVGDRKIASIGLHRRRGMSAHGFAVNVDNSVEPFHQVTACGLPGRADDLDRARDRPGAQPALLPQARGLRLRAGSRTASAARHADAPGSGHWRRRARLGTGSPRAFASKRPRRSSAVRRSTWRC